MVITDVVQQVRHAYMQGSYGRRSKNGFFLRLHPETHYYFRKHDFYHVEFLKSGDIEYWFMDIRLIEDPRMEIGAFSFLTTPITNEDNLK